MGARKFTLPPFGPLPRGVVPVLVILASLSFIPLALIARSRATRSPVPRIQIIPDMDQQPKFRSQSANPIFADGRAMRPAVEGTVSRRGGDLDPHLYRGLVVTTPVTGSRASAMQAGGSAGSGAPVGGAEGLAWAETFPFPLTEQVVKRGQERFDIYCALCHGLAGAGDGIVHQRAERLQEGTWTPPSDLSSDVVVSRPVGHLFNSITNGIRNMPAYGPQIPVEDRWAIVAYVRALQRSRYTTVDDVPPELRGSLR